MTEETLAIMLFKMDQKVIYTSLSLQVTTVDRADMRSRKDTQFNIDSLDPSVAAKYIYTSTWRSNRISLK